MILLIISIILATPVAWMFNELLLQQFAMRITVNLKIIGGGILIMFILGILTVFSQTYKASGTNPVDVLKYE